MGSWTIEVSKITKAKPENIWKLWENVEGWPKWNEALEWSRLLGNFEKGIFGEIKAKGWPVSHFEIIEIAPNRKFKDVSKMPMTILEFSHEICELGQGRTQITHRVSVKGLFSLPLKWTMGKKLNENLPKALDKLAQLAEEMQD